MRIGIVNDSSIAAELLRRLIHTSEEHQIAWIARDGAEAVKLCESDTRSDGSDHAIYGRRGGYLSHHGSDALSDTDCDGERWRKCRQSF